VALLSLHFKNPLLAIGATGKLQALSNTIGDIWKSQGKDIKSLKDLLDLKCDLEDRRDRSTSIFGSKMIQTLRV
jgi:hypothetical protein